MDEVAYNIMTRTRGRSGSSLHNNVTIRPILFLIIELTNNIRPEKEYVFVYFILFGSSMSCAVAIHDDLFSRSRRWCRWCRNRSSLSPRSDTRHLALSQVYTQEGVSCIGVWCSF